MIRLFRAFPGPGDEARIEGHRKDEKPGGLVESAVMMRAIESQKKPSFRACRSTIIRQAQREGREVQTGSSFRLIALPRAA